jgi:hypothetical protein
MTTISIAYPNVHPIESSVADERNVLSRFQQGVLAKTLATLLAFYCPVLFSAEASESHATNSECYSFADATREALEATPSYTQSPASDRFKQFAYRIASALDDAGLEEQHALIASSDWLDRCVHLFALLPEGIELPEVTLLPDGILTFDWAHDPSWQLALALAPGDTLSYAGYFKGTRSHGAYPLYADRLPEEVGLGLRRWALGPYSSIV